MSSRRVFIGIDVSEEARAAASQHIQELRRTAADVRVSWEKPEKLHVTLEFLGNVDDAALRDLSEELALVAAKTNSFTADLLGLGVFPNVRQPRILWLGIENDAGVMKDVVASVENVCSRFGFQRERRTFSPHVTIGRIREPQKGRGLAERHLEMGFDAVTFDVDELVVYESTLSPTGSAYKAVRRFRLRRPG
jgi:2'-5' RNA ligase